ncbi:MAG: S9 family peptidase, partial [Planctomycetales bacterium]|nr:S9 family peptidase [Planctomycetales bacterium]
ILHGQLVLEYLQDATSRVKVYELTGAHLHDVPLPGIGSVAGFSGRQDDTETFFTFASFVTPPAIYRYDLSTNSVELIRKSHVDFNSDDFEVQQVFFPSKDGTRIPMFITHRKGIQRDGNNPTLLYGYGGFNISLTPRFSVSYVTWIEMGGVVAIPNLRGGGEYGEDWHQQGKLARKQNVFDDFIAAADCLIENNLTSPEKLGIQGGSNGGLLVGAVMTQRPDLYGACLPAVGVMDMLRFHRFTAGRFWCDEYGSSDDAEQFRALIKYSPYHNLKPGTKYPPTLVTTADTDDRVVPMHSFKFAAALQHSQEGDAPTLIRIESRAGHGAGTPTTKQIDLVADQWAFLAHHLGLEIKPH